jgi:hypothetical protein
MRLLISRDAHKSIVAGLIFSGLRPFWVHPRWDAELQRRAEQCFAMIDQISGYQATDWLREHERIDIGLTDHRRILATLSMADDESSAQRLRGAHWSRARLNCRDRILSSCQSLTTSSSRACSGPATPFSVQLKPCPSTTP